MINACLTIQNLTIYWTKSGKMDTPIAIEWLKTVKLSILVLLLICLIQDFLPNAGKDSCLIIDAWTGFARMMQIPEVKKSNLTIYQLPKGSTPILQPADVFYNRTLKHFFRRASDKIRLQRLDFTISVRDNLLHLLDWVYFQFKCPRYKNFLLYSWYKAGFSTIHPPSFETPIEFCFDFSHIFICEVSNCGRKVFNKCSYCEKYMCFHCSIFHRH